MIDELGRAIREQDIFLRCAGTLGELRTYVRDEKGSMGGSPHDDRVMSLAIANQMLGYAYAPEYKEERDDYWTIDWWSNLSSNGEVASEDWVIGSNSLRSQ
jgi:hypothetical protein